VAAVALDAVEPALTLSGGAPWGSTNDQLSVAKSKAPSAGYYSIEAFRWTASATFLGTLPLTSCCRAIAGA
jgi:hypothetical protein